MKLSGRKTCLFALLVLMSCAGLAQGQEAAPPDPFTLWRFLGIPEGIRRVRGNLVNRRGNFPNLEQRPPMKALADPRNLFSENPAIKAAAEIKAAELQAPQKIKALKYLAKMGCGCYDKDGKITNALLAAMAEDCTERVRLEAVEAVSTAARGQVCDECNLRCCCNDKIIQQLAVIAYERDEFGCWVEPSARVRRAAEEALRACCNGGPPELLPPPIEGVEGVEPREGAEGVERLPPTASYGSPFAPPPHVGDSFVTASLRSDAGVGFSAYPDSPPPAYPGSPMPAATSGVAQDFDGYDPAPQAEIATGDIEGAVVNVDHARSRATGRFTTLGVVPVGTYLHVYQEGPDGVRAVGSLLIAASSAGEATVIARPGSNLNAIAAGDVVVGTAGTSRRQ